MILEQVKAIDILNHYQSHIQYEVDKVFTFLDNFNIIEVKDENDFWHASHRHKYKYEEYLHISLDSLPDKLMYQNQEEYNAFMQSNSASFLALKHKELKVHHSKNIFYQRFNSRKTKINDLLKVVDEIFQTYNNKKRSNICFLLSGNETQRTEIVEVLCLHLALKAFYYELSSSSIKIVPKFSLFIIPPLDEKLSPRIMEAQIKKLFIHLIVSNRNLNEGFLQLTNLMDACTTRDYTFTKQLNLFKYNINNFTQNILLTGEKGTGKTRIAQKIHELSFRAQEAFLDTNSATLKEEELVGWKKNSFTDAKEDRDGYFKTAAKGTLFFDEIGRANKEVRDTLIKFIQDKKYTPRGYNIPIKSDARLMFGSNADFQRLVSDGNFEEDFHDRINQVKLYLPKLNERIGDIPLLVETFLSDYNLENKTKIVIDHKVTEYLMGLNWPGNIRELEGYLKKLLIVVKGKGGAILKYDLCQDYPREVPKLSKKDFSKLERILIDVLYAHDFETGSFLDSFIKPILSKIYLEDFQNGMNLTEKYDQAKNIIGLGGKDFSRSALEKAYQKYKELFR